MAATRRDFLRRSAAYAAGFAALRYSLSGEKVVAGTLDTASPYGPLLADPMGVLDLPAGFLYRIVSRSGDVMDDGFFVPGLPDGMATFAGPDGLTLLIRNHELLPNQGPSPFGEKNELLDKLDPASLYDFGRGKFPHRGGTTTVVYDTRRQEVVRQFLSIAGTCRNCAGGPTPWHSWITCEETIIRRGDLVYECEQDHGYNFEVPVSAEFGLAAPTPLKEMGRFNHEAIAVDPRSGVVYQTEDRDDGLIYRYLPNTPGQLHRGGRLQALRYADAASVDARNWESQNVQVGAPLPVRWFDMEEIDAPLDDLRLRGFEAGAARFARGEGMWHTGEELYFACTNGGLKKKGQIWRYVPQLDGGGGGPEEAGALELFIEPNDSALLEAADNLTAAPWGDLFLCEDRDGQVVRVLGVTLSGEVYPFAMNHLNTEFAGVTFSPDGSTMFVNLQHKGITVAVTGPWRGDS